MQPDLARIPERLREVLRDTELEAEVTIEGDEDGWTVTVELDHFEQFEQDGDSEPKGRKLHVVVAGSGATPNEAADNVAARLTEALAAVPEPWSVRKPAN